MSKLLTLGILQQVQNAGGGGDDGVLYDGEMTVGQSGGGGAGYRSGLYGSISPVVSAWTECCVIYEEVGMGFAHNFYSDYPNIGSVLRHYEFGGTVYSSSGALFEYLDSEDGNTISLKVYEDAQ